MCSYLFSRNAYIIAGWKHITPKITLSQVSPRIPINHARDLSKEMSSQRQECDILSIWETDPSLWAILDVGNWSCEFEHG